jgi:hypothetical protein
MDIPLGVPNNLQYNLKATAVSSTNKMVSNPADGTDKYDGTTTSVLRFVIPHSAYDEFCDPSMSRIRLQMQLIIPNNTLMTTDGTRPQNYNAKSLYNDNRDLETIFLDRGIESIIRRLEIFDTNGNRLESIDNYNCLYAVTELCTALPEVRQGRGRFTFECLTESNYERGSELWPCNKNFYQTIDTNANQPRTYELTFNLISGVFGGTAEKYWPLKTINGLVIELQLENPVDCLCYKFTPYNTLTKNAITKSINLTDGGLTNDLNINGADWNARAQNARQAWTAYINTDIPAQESPDLADNNAGPVTQNSYGQFYPHGGADPGPSNYPFQGRTEYDPVRGEIVLSKTFQNSIQYRITRPALQLNRIYIPGEVGPQLVNAGKRSSPDGRLRIQTHSWKVLSTQILPTATYFSYIIPCKVSSLKAVFFTITPDINTGDMSRSKTQFINRNLIDYQFYYDLETVLNQPCRVTYPGTEAFHELCRAWNVAHKTMDAPTLIKMEEYNQQFKQNDLTGFYQDPNSCVYGVDLESFASKNNVMDSGVNTRNVDLRIELNFAPYSITNADGTLRENREWGASQTIRFYCMYDMFISINDSDGSISNEY